ncbi:MAG: rhodanese-like domain-containing protein [Paracoccaceae bacterium]
MERFARIDGYGRQGSAPLFIPRGAHQAPNPPAGLISRPMSLAALAPYLVIALLTAFVIPAAASAQAVRLTVDAHDRSFSINGRSYTIDRIQDETHELSGEYAKTSRACPPFCITPMKATDDVETIGELEVMDFLEEVAAKNEGYLLDTRLPGWFQQGTIPGAVNVPFTTLEETNPYRDDIVTALGGLKEGDKWDFSAARQLVIFCNGPWCLQAPMAVRALRKVGYPAQKIKYYRGGMQVWSSLGLSTIKP